MISTLRRVAFCGLLVSATIAIAPIASAADFYGTEGQDNYTGTTSADTFHMKGGADVVQALAGNDYIEMDEGPDTARGSAGADEIHGGLGGTFENPDLLKGEDGNDLLYDTLDSNDYDVTCGGYLDDYSNILDGDGLDFFFGGTGTDSWSKNANDYADVTVGCPI